MLASHMARCPDCLEFETSVASFTKAIRSAPLEVLERPVMVTRRRRVSFVHSQIGVAAALAVAVLASAGQIAGGDAQRAAVAPTLEQPLRFETTAQLAREIELITAAQRGTRSDDTQGTTLPL